MGQTVLSLGQNLLEILKRYNNEPYVFFTKVGQIILKEQYGSTRIGQPVLSLIQIFQKMLETEIKHDLLMEINKESLRGQCGSDCHIF